MSFNLPALPDGWEYRPIESCAQPKSISYGVVQPGKPVSDGVQIIRVNNFRDNGLALTEVMTISPEVESKYTRTRLYGGEVLLTLVGSVGQVSVVPESLTGFNVARAVAVIRPLPYISAEWIALCLRSPLSQHLLGSRANTTVQTTINLKDVRALPIPIPPDAERENITALISALDNRIALLRETNATLEAIAQALFKSWFVDFAPVHAKQQGLPPEGMDEATAALFPDSFEESRLGLVPMGWSVGTVENLGDVICGKTPSTKKPEYYGEDVPFIKIPDMHNRLVITSTNRMLSQLGAESQKKKYLPAGAICVSCIATPGLVIRTTSTSQTNQQINSVIPLAKWGKSYPLFLLKLIGHDVRIAGSGGSVFHNLNKTQFQELKLLLANQPVIEAFNEIVEPLVVKIEHNQRQAETLSTLRDTLLPRLISGQLQMPEAEEMLESA